MQTLHVQSVRQTANWLADMALHSYNGVRPHIRETPLLRSPWLSSCGGVGCRVYLKLESEQHTGSFKVRGAVNKVLNIPPAQLRNGLVTSSTGNAALAFVYACSVTGARTAPSMIFLPTTASEAKVSRLRAQGALLRQHGADCVVAEVEARRVAQERGWTYISPYNDAQVMAGQGTLAVELLQQLPDGFDVAIVPVGGGGLIAGVAAVLKSVSRHIQVIGVQPAASDVMRQSVAAGRIVQADCELDTLSDATAGGIEQGALTLQPCMDFVDAWVCVSEQEIADAMVSLLHHHSKLVEGAAGCAVAAVKQLGPRLQGKRVVVVCCGGNVSVPTLHKVLSVGRVW